MSSGFLHLETAANVYARQTGTGIGNERGRLCSSTVDRVIGGKFMRHYPDDMRSLMRRECRGTM
jgi:hypothetical protein